MKREEKNRLEESKTAADVKIEIAISYIILIIIGSTKKRL
jgi:hypothetical protein